MLKCSRIESKKKLRYKYHKIQLENRFEDRLFIQKNNYKILQ